MSDQEQLRNWFEADVLESVDELELPSDNRAPFDRSDDTGEYLHPGVQMLWLVWLKAFNRGEALSDLDEQGRWI